MGYPFRQSDMLTGEWHLKFHYLPDRNSTMTLVAKQRISFGQILEILKNEWGV